MEHDEDPSLARRIAALEATTAWHTQLLSQTALAAYSSGLAVKHLADRIAGIERLLRLNHEEGPVVANSNMHAEKLADLILKQAGHEQ